MLNHKTTPDDVLRYLGFPTYFLSPEEKVALTGVQLTWQEPGKLLVDLWGTFAGRGPDGADYHSKRYVLNDNGWVQRL